MKTSQFPEFETDQNTASEESSFDLRAVWQVIYSRRWIILSLTLLIGLLGTLLVFRQTPIYSAAATLLIERSPVQFSPIQDPFIRYSEHFLYYQTQYGLIKRRAIGRRVVEELGLEPDPAAVPDSPPERPWWQRWMPEAWFPAPPPMTYDQLLENRIQGIVNSISVQPQQNSQLVDVRVSHSDPEMAAALANAASEAFIEDNLQGRLEMSTQAASYLTERLAELRDKLVESEAALQAYRDREELLESHGGDALAARQLSMATEKLTDARRARSELEVINREIEARANDPDFGPEAIPRVLNVPTVQAATRAVDGAQRRVDELAIRYGPKWPSMVEAQSELDAANRALQRQLDLVIENLQSDYRAAVAAERSAAAELERVRAAARQRDRQEFNLSTLERDVETNQQIFEKFQTQFKESTASGEVQTANARLVEPALVPRYPVRPNKQRGAMLALLIGLLVSLGLAFLLDFLDNAVRSAEDIETRLALPVLGLLPRLKSAAKDRLAPMREYARQRGSAFAEAVRTIRTGLLLAGMDDSRQVILVTSSVPGEGKTTLTLNLALALGELHRVVVIDADMRRPTVAQALKETRGHPGLSHFVSGEAELRKCITSITDSVDVIAAGTVPPNPLELLSSLRFSKAIEQLSSHYDHVLIDCAPALAVSDAMMLSSLVSGVVYVVRADSTPRPAVAAGLKRLKRGGARVIGAVINQAELRSARYRGRYSGYYGSSYYSDYGYVHRQDQSEQ